MRTGLMLTATLMLAACGDRPAVADGRLPDANRARLAAASGEAARPAAPARRDDRGHEPGGAWFVGTWTGPEGLSFVVAPAGPGRYRVHNRDTLDDASVFDATQADGGLRFVRRGETFVARPGTGGETGFKWLAQKRRCLIVRPGIEGYCRD